MLLVSYILVSCTYINDENEKNVVIPPPPTFEENQVNNFSKLAFDCIKNGKVSDASKLNNLYKQSYKDRNYPKPLIFQTRELSVLHNKCMQKVINENHPEFNDEIITSPFYIARISRYFYAQGQFDDGAYWMENLINLQGMAKAYYTAGLLFIGKAETMAIGARLLAESSHLGNNQATSILNQINSVNSIKRLQLDAIQKFNSTSK